MPALVAAGGVCGLTALPANALELGEVNVESALGQPLRASIAYALNANEQLHSYCISLRSGAQGSDAPAVHDARISVTGNRIQLSGNAAIREPLLNMQVVVDCAYTPHLVREYVLLIDPIISNVAAQSMLASSTSTERNTQAATATSTGSLTGTSPASGKRIVTNRLPVATSPIATNTRYRVQSNDTVSTIASRTENRTLGLWRSVDVIFAANPDAFVNRDVNRLIAGSELFIPDLSGVAIAESENSTILPASDIDESRIVAEPVDELTTTEALPVVAANVSYEIAEEVVEIGEAPVVTDALFVSEVPDAIEQNTTLQPGDVVMPTAGNAQPEITSPQATIASQPNNQPIAAPVVSSSAADSAGTSGAWNWLLWLAGSGIALILGLFLFGRKIKERFGAIEAGKSATPDRRPNIVADVDFEFEDTISAEAISLDADLEAGTGLNSGAQIDIAEDFGFSANGQTESKLDLELTESAAREPEVHPTDIIAPNHREEEPSILAAEEPATDTDDGEYDLSMIVDATKQPLDQFDATAKDLQAVQIDQTDMVADNNDYTMSSAVNFQELEQDYQEEFTATQAANAEIERVAMELASRMDENDAIDVTREMPVTESAADELSEIDLTAELPGPDAASEIPAIDLPAVSDSSVTAELTANLPTSIDAENDPDIDGDVSNASVEMSAGSDITIDMNIQSGKVDTKKK